MNIIIVGQGAMGLLWYHHILQLITANTYYHKSQLHLIASTVSAESKNCDKQALHQYNITDHDGYPHNGTLYYATPKNIAQADVIFLCVKSFQISSALTSIINDLKENCAIILAHNGMGTLATLPKHVEKKHNIYTLLTTHGCLRTASYCITHTGTGSSDFGLLLGENNTLEQESLTQLLNNALPNVNYHQQILNKQWLKLAINCVINPLTAINNINNGQIITPLYQNIINSLLKEVVVIAKIEGVWLDFNELKQKITEVAQATAKNSSSMRCDILANRRSEIDYINGYIHHLGIKHSIATPENTNMYQAVKKLETMGLNPTTELRIKSKHV